MSKPAPPGIGGSNSMSIPTMTPIGNSSGGSKPGGGSSMPQKPGGGGGMPQKPEVGGDYDWSLGMPLSKETDSTYGGSKPGKAPTLKTPEAPDPFKLIQEQAKVNRTNEIGPSGSTTNYIDPKTGVWTQRRTFSEPLQGLYNKQIDLLKNPLSTDFSADSKALEDATYQRGYNLLNPEFTNRQKDLESQLYNQGVFPGSEAWVREMDALNRDRGETYEKLALDAVGAGRAEQGRMFGQYMDSRQSQFNELAALLGGQQVARPASLDVMGRFSQQYQGQLQSVSDANANAAARNAQTSSAAASLGSLAMMLMMSSVETKEEFKTVSEEEILEGVSELPVEKWKYRDGMADGNEHIGPYAEDFQRIFGLGNGKEISGIDAIGICLASIKALTKRVQELENGR